MAGKNKKWCLGIDIGGTKILSGILDRRFRILSEIKSKLESHRGEKFFFKTLTKDIETLIKKEKIHARKISVIGIGCPGMIETKKGMVRLSPNISFMKNYPLKSKVENYFGIPVFVENDVNAGLYGESQFGAAKGYRCIAGIFLGTGVGGAFIFDGKLYRGVTGAAGEIGHTFINQPSFLPGEIKKGTVEALIGRHAISAEASLLILRQKASKLYKTVGFDIKKIKSKSLRNAVREGDRELRILLEDKSKLLGVAMANIVNLLNPELIVLGGGLMEALGSIILPEAKRTMRKLALKPVVRVVEVKPAKLKDDAIVLGAAKLAFDTLVKS